MNIDFNKFDVLLEQWFEQPTPELATEITELALTVDKDNDDEQAEVFARIGVMLRVPGGKKGMIATEGWVKWAEANRHKIVDEDPTFLEKRKAARARVNEKFNLMPAWRDSF